MWWCLSCSGSWQWRATSRGRWMASILVVEDAAAHFVHVVHGPSVLRPYLIPFIPDSPTRVTPRLNADFASSRS